MPHYFIALKRKNLKTNMKEEFRFSYKDSRGLTRENIIREYQKICKEGDFFKETGEYSKIEVSYFRLVNKKFIMPEVINKWEPLVKLRKNVQYYVVTWYRFTPTKDRTVNAPSVTEYFHLVIPSSKANPNDGTAEFNRLSNLDIGYRSNKRNSGLEIDDKEYFKYWKSSSAMYSIGVELFDDLENLPDILNHWYELKELNKWYETKDQHISVLYPQYGLKKEDVSFDGITKQDIHTMMQFRQSGSSRKECVEWITKSLSERAERAKQPEPPPLNLSPEVKKMVQDMFHGVFKSDKN